MLDIPAAWRAILAVDDERQFSRAAARLGMSQPQLSRLIATTEKRFGYQIFDRRPYARATASGQVLVSALRTAVSELAEAAAKGQRIFAGTGGHVTIGFASTVMATSFPFSLQAFGRDYPHVNIRLKEMHSSEQEQAIIDGIIDLAVGRETPSSREIQSQLIFEDELVAALSVSHALAAKKSLGLGDLAEERFIIFDRSCAPALHDQIVGACSAAGFSPHIFHFAREWNTILALVAADYGVSLVPRSLGALKWPNLTIRTFEDQGNSVALYLHWLRDHLSPAAALLMKYISATELAAQAN